MCDTIIFDLIQCLYMCHLKQPILLLVVLAKTELLVARTSKRPNDLPKYTYGLEGKLLDLIGEPIALAQKAVRSKFETETSSNDGPGCVRYTYHTQKHLTYVD